MLSGPNEVNKMTATRIPKVKASRWTIWPRYRKPTSDRPGYWDVRFVTGSRREPKLPKWMKQLGFEHASEDEGRAWIVSTRSLPLEERTIDRLKHIVIQALKNGALMDCPSLDEALDLVKKFQLYGHLW